MLTKVGQAASGSFSQNELKPGAAISIVHEWKSRMIAGNRRAGTLVLGLVVVLLLLSFFVVSRAHWKTRHPVPQKSVISFNPAVAPN